MSTFRAFGAKQYGPWSDPRLPQELREPFSAWSWSESEEYGKPLKSPTGEIVVGLFFAAVAAFPLVLALVVAPDRSSRNAGLAVAAVMLVILLPLAIYFLRVGLTRRAWVGRVKRVTGMSPFTMNRERIPPPGCETG